MATYTLDNFSKEVQDISPNRTTYIRGRYDTKVRLRLEDNTVIVRNLKANDLVATLTDADLVHSITLNEVSRPDLVALKYYGDARLYWIILAANDLKYKDELVYDMTIRIPSKQAVYGSNGILSV